MGSIIFPGLNDGLHLKQLKKDIKVLNIEKDGKFSVKSRGSSIDRLEY